MAANSESLRPHCECRICFSHNVFQSVRNVTDDDFVSALGRVSPALLLKNVVTSRSLAENDANIIKERNYLFTLGEALE